MATKEPCLPVFMPILISQGCCNKLPQPGWLEIQMHSLTVLEARSLKSKCFGRAALPLKAPGEDPSLPLPASGNPRCFLPWAAPLQSLPSRGLFVCVCGTYPLTRIPVIPV